MSKKNSTPDRLRFRAGIFGYLYPSSLQHYECEGQFVFADIDMNIVEEVKRGKNNTINDN